MRIATYVVMGRNPGSGEMQPFICNTDERVAKLAMDEMIDAILLSNSMRTPSERAEVEEAVNTFHITEAIVEIIHG